MADHKHTYELGVVVNFYKGPWDRERREDHEIYAQCGCGHEIDAYEIERILNEAEE